MLFLLMMAVKYAQRDWSRKNQKAIASRIHRQASAPAAVATGPEGRPYDLRKESTRRHLQLLSGDAHVPNQWLALARGLSDRETPGAVVGALRMALASGGESASMKNDFGVALLQQKRMRQAYAQFHAALQIKPGFPPATFNLALCAIAERNPSGACALLSRYLARRPDDVNAYRLQSTLLVQLGRSQEALAMLEKYLRDQPPEQPLFLEAALLAAKLGQNAKALRYLETSIAGNPIQGVVRAYQSSSFRSIRLSGEGDALAARMANRARVALGTTVPVDEFQPLRATPDAILR